MDAAICSAPGIGADVSFGDDHFGSCVFGDKRLTDRAVLTGNTMMRHPGGTLPEKLPRAELFGFYDFANNDKVNHDNVLAGHIQHTREAMEQCAGPVLIIHDTTEGDYSGLNIAKLGPIGNGHNKGMLIHNVLAFDYGSREVLGLAGQILQIRRHAGKRESVSFSRQHPQRESLLWIKGAKAVGRPPEGAMWVNLSDRGGDTYESLEYQKNQEQFFIVRSRVDRNVNVEGKDGRMLGRKLHGVARKLPTLGERTLEVSANAGQQARTAQVRVAAGPVQLQAPHVRYGEHSRQPLSAWVVHVKELQPPAGQEPLEWILLTNIPTENKAQAWERVDWYQCRPIVEEFHKAQKTGCGMELAQFTTLKALEVVVAMTSVVAVQLLRLRDLARKNDDRPASDIIADVYIETLTLKIHKEAKMSISAKDFLRALARLGGHLGRTGDRPPGWLVLWRGWTQLQPLVEGVRLARMKRRG